MIKKLLLSVIAMLSIATVSAQTYWPEDTWGQPNYDENNCRYILHDDGTAELIGTNVWNNISNDIIKEKITANGKEYKVTTISGTVAYTDQNNGVTYYNGAFKSRNFEDNKIVIPDWITTITNGAFQMASSLQSVTFGSGLETIGDYAFEACTGLSEIKFFTDKDASENEKLTSIGKYAFSQVGDGAVEPLKIIFPGSIQHIWDYAFYNSHIQALCFAKDSQEREDLNVHKDAFNLCEHLNTIELYCSIVGEEAFKDCQYLKKLVIGKGVEKICKRAFCDTQSLETIVVGCTTPPVCEADAFLGAGYANSQKEINGIDQNDNNPETNNHNSGEYKDADGNVVNYNGQELHYVNVRLAVNNYDAVYAKYKAYRTKDAEGNFNYQGWEKDRTNQFFIEFVPTEDNDARPSNEDFLASTDQNWYKDNMYSIPTSSTYQMQYSNFYYSPMTYEEVKTDPDISDPDEIQIFDYTTGIENVTTDKDATSAAKVYTTTGTINVVAEEGTPVAVYSITGAQVYNGCDNTISVNPGLYIVRVADRSTKVIVK